SAACPRTCEVIVGQAPLWLVRNDRREAIGAHETAGIRVHYESRAPFWGAYPGSVFVLIGIVRGVPPQILTARVGHDAVRERRGEEESIVHLGGDRVVHDASAVRVLERYERATCRRSLVVGGELDTTIRVDRDAARPHRDATADLPVGQIGSIGLEPQHVR